MEYLVRLTFRALRDLESIYEFIQADNSNAAFAWFNDLAKTIETLERHPERGSAVAESKSHRQLLFGEKPDVYRIIYSIDKRKAFVNVLHIRHGARASLPAG